MSERELKSRATGNYGLGQTAERLVALLQVTSAEDQRPRAIRTVTAQALAERAEREPSARILLEHTCLGQGTHQAL